MDMSPRFEYWFTTSTFLFRCYANDDVEAWKELEKAGFSKGDIIKAIKYVPVMLC
jgi:uncharacterized protein Smg (DUF494 family)